MNTDQMMFQAKLIAALTKDLTTEQAKAAAERLDALGQEFNESEQRFCKSAGEGLVRFAAERDATAEHAWEALGPVVDTHVMNLPFPEYQADGGAVAIEALKLVDGQLLVSLVIQDDPEERMDGTYESVEIWKGALKRPPIY